MRSLILKSNTNFWLLFFSIALVETLTPFPIYPAILTVAPIRLPVNETYPIAGTILGWGATRPGAALSASLQRLDKFIWTDQNQCRNATRGHPWFDATKICTFARIGAG
jgi:hypothetical protein